MKHELTYLPDEGLYNTFSIVLNLVLLKKLYAAQMRIYPG